MLGFGGGVRGRRGGGRCGIRFGLRSRHINFRRRRNRRGGDVPTAALRCDTRVIKNKTQMKQNTQLTINATFPSLSPPPPPPSNADG